MATESTCISLFRRNICIYYAMSIYASEMVSSSIFCYICIVYHARVMGIKMENIITHLPNLFHISVVGVAL